VRVSLVVVAVFALATPSAAPTVAGDWYERPRIGLSVMVPNGWRVVRKPLSPCTNPAQRIALRGHGALVQIVEELGVSHLERYPLRPRGFTLRGEPEYFGCCPPAEGKGWFMSFRDGSRAFYAYVQLSRPGTRSEALAILDSLDVRPV
jgi:hypothetical protein